MVLQWFLYQMDILYTRTKSVDLLDLLESSSIKKDAFNEKEIEVVSTIKEVFLKAETEKTAKLIEHMQFQEKEAKEQQLKVGNLYYIKIRFSMNISRIP